MRNKICRFHSEVVLEMGQDYKSFLNMNEAMTFKKNNPYYNGHIFTKDGHILKENFTCKCKGTGYNERL